MDTLFKFRFRISLFGRVTIGLLVLLAMGIQPTVHAQGISDPIPPGDQVVPGAFLKGSPVNNTTFPAGSAVTLAWGTSTNATNYYYCFDKTNDKNCGSIWYWNDNTDITINATGGDLEPGATYYWQVMACSSGDPKPSGCIEANGGTWWSFKVSPTVIRSTGSQDGWILESSENSGTGGQLDVNSTTLRIGDSTSDRQYLAILSFNTSSLPDDAYITSVVLKI